MLILTIKGSVSLVSLEGPMLGGPMVVLSGMARTAIPRVFIIAARHHGKNTNKSISSSDGNTAPSDDCSEIVLAIKIRVFLWEIIMRG